MRRRWISKSRTPSRRMRARSCSTPGRRSKATGRSRRSARCSPSADRQFPGAVWSFSIGWGCDKLITAADLAPARSALATALSHGTSAFNASGDLAGLECKGGDDWSSPPGDVRHRAGFRGIAAGDDRRRRHDAVHRRRRPMALRAGVVRRAVVHRYRRRRVLVVRPPRMAARGAARPGPHAAG